MAVRGSALRLSCSAKKRLNPISSQIPLPLTMGTTGPPGEEFPAEKGFTVFVYLAQTVCLVAYRPPPPSSESSPAVCVCVLSAAHSDMPFTDTHHPVIKMPAGSIRSMFVRSVLEFQFLPSNPRDPERKLENGWSQILPVKG